jgi:hypothetical protein
MLPAHLVADNGLKCIEEYPNLSSNLRRDVGDELLVISHWKQSRSPYRVIGSQKCYLIAGTP